MSTDTNDTWYDDGAEGSSVLVRMYRQGLGDCFLVTLPGRNGKPFRLMIDCGVLQGTANASEKMQGVVEDIITETDGFVDVLAVTHEHWDHVSGFAQAHDLFAAPGEPAVGRLSVGQLWLAWTEDPEDALARQLRQEREETLRGLWAFVDNATAQGFGATPVLQGVRELLGFFGAARNTTTGAMDRAKALGRRRPRYWRPVHAPWEDAAVPGIRIYALGPPHEHAAIKRLNAKREIYHELANAALSGAFFAAADVHFGGGAGDDEEAALHYPFDPAYWQPHLDWSAEQQADEKTGRPGADVVDFFTEHYGDAATAWRKIDDEWLSTSADFALRLDSATNNTSLVLAIEMVASGRVLLFAADAQAGNWLSWQDLSWQLADGSQVTGPDLLNRTVFYKVGHHGSHNATMKEKGLEQMSRQEFVAFLPVDIAAARKRRWNRMPLPGLVAAMREQARGRVVQLDEATPEIEDAALRADFESRLTETPLYYEYRVGD